jgi:hypothetical protein
MNTTKPTAMPTPARPKPAHQPTYWPSSPQISDAQNDPDDDQRDRQVEGVHSGLVLGHLHLIGALGQVVGQGRTGRQALDRHAAVGRRAEGIGLAGHDDAGLQVLHPALRRHLVGLAGIGQGLGGGLAFIGHGEVAGGQQQGAEQHRLAGAQIAVGEDAAEQGQQIDQRGVGTVLGAGRGLVEQQVLGQVEDQDAAHPVIGEPLPHLGEEQDDQTARMVSQQLKEDRHAGGKRDDQPDQDDEIHVGVFRSLDNRRLSGLFHPRLALLAADDHAKSAKTSKARPGTGAHGALAPSQAFTPGKETPP